MWLSILLVLFAWFVGALVLGILTGKSMALGNRPGCCPDEFREECDGNCLAEALERLEAQHSQMVLGDLQPAKH